MITWNDIKHFEPLEFRCRGCQIAGMCQKDQPSDGREMSIDFVFKLDDLRERLGFPFIVTSGYRCPAYNASISTTGDDGPHTTGRAVDLSLSGANVHRLIRQVSLGGWMTGIGLNQKGEHIGRFVHLDDLAAPQHPRPRVWTY